MYRFPKKYQFPKKVLVSGLSSSCCNHAMMCALVNFGLHIHVHSQPNWHSFFFTSRIHIFILNIWFGFSFFWKDKKFPIPVTCYNSRNLLNQLTALLFQELEHIRIDTLFCHDSRKCLVWKPGFVLWCCLLIHRGRCWRLHWITNFCLLSECVGIGSLISVAWLMKCELWKDIKPQGDLSH